MKDNYDFIHGKRRATKNSVQKAQSMVGKYIKNDESLVDILFDDRKSEVTNEY